MVYQVIIRIEGFLPSVPAKKMDDNFFAEAAVKKLFVQYNISLPSSVAVERLFSLGIDILKPKCSGLNDEHFEMQFAFLKGN